MFIIFQPFNPYKNVVIYYLEQDIIGMHDIFKVHEVLRKRRLITYNQKQLKDKRTLIKI